MLLFLFIASAPLLLNAQGNRPKIGVTLSGGGAKGLAHVGLLEAIDSAGIRTDYITGTSMGSIIGALYAAGYSGKDIEKMARGLDWNVLLSNQLPLTRLIMEEKSEYGRYALEVPFQKGRFKLSTGLLAGQELWIKFSELFFRVYDVKDFDNFIIPFKCIATNAINGEAVVLDSGEVVKAIRSSMAIPTVFSAMEHEQMTLVDGGVVRNFPVSDVRAMGANFVIGSNVSTGLYAREKLDNPVSILLNTVFFMESRDAAKEIPLCDIYVPMPVESFSTGSFSKGPEILDTGIMVGNALYGRFKKLKDSLDAIYGVQAPRPAHGPWPDSVYISGAEVKGLVHTNPLFFYGMTGFSSNRYFTPFQLSNVIRRGIGVRYYTTITYSLHKQPDGSARIIFEVEEAPLSSAKVGIHFNKYTGISLIANFTTRNLVTKNSRTLLTVNLGENFKVRGEHMAFHGPKKKLASILGVYYEAMNLDSYQDFKALGRSKQYYFNSGLQFQYSTNRNLTVGLGTRYERLKYVPSFLLALDLEGRSNYMNTFVYLKHNTLDRTWFPNRGTKIDLSFQYIWAQRGNLVFDSSGTPILNTDSLELNYDPYTRMEFNFEQYAKIGRRGTFNVLLQSGINFNYHLYFLNDFYVGGLTPVMRNQVLFAGYGESTITTGSIVALQLGYRYNLFNNFYLQWRSNAAVYDFVNRKINGTSAHFLSGHALTASYMTVIGPIEFSLMHGDQSGSFRTYVNIGFNF